VQNGEQRSVSCEWLSFVLCDSSIFCIELSIGTSTQGMAVRTKMYIDNIAEKIFISWFANITDKILCSLFNPPKSI
jgi:hypothetical protein